MRRTIRRVAPVVAVVMIFAALTTVTDAGASASSQAAAVSPAGPRLSFPQATLDAAISCRWVDTAHRHEPVLLVHGTVATAAENWGWNYQRVLPTKGFDTCVVQMPNRSLVVRRNSPALRRTAAPCRAHFGKTAPKPSYSKPEK